METGGVNHSNRTELKVVAMAATFVSIAAFVCFYSSGEILLYGDAVAHINIARRVFDSGSPGPLQLGTVWLPFPHIAMMPFIVNDWLWRTGIGGAIPSMIAYVFGVMGIYRLVRAHFRKYAAVAAALVYALNPNLLYMQSTPMTESIFLATVIWSLVYLDEFVSGIGDSAAWNGLAPEKALERCAMVLAAAILTRYDGWVLAGICGVVVLVTLSRHWRGLDGAARKRLSRSAIGFYLLCGLTGVLWLAQNYAISGNPLDFINGPYSARAIEQRTMHLGQPGHPGTGDMRVSAIFFLKAAKLNMAWGQTLEAQIFGVMLIGTLLVIVRWSLKGVMLLLWFVLPFYAYSIAYGSVPIFMPVWWPHSYYNVRYGLELLPAFAVFLGVAFGTANGWLAIGRGRYIITSFGVMLVGAGYISSALATPICLREARVNSVTRIGLERKLGEELAKLPPNSKILMFTGEFVGAFEREGIPLRRVVSESVHTDWDNAMADPAHYADYVVTVKGDPVWWAVKTFPAGLERIAEFDPRGKPMVTIYRSTVATRKNER
jgi:hypothetical protein